MYPTAWEVSDLNLAEGKSLSEPKRRFIAQSLSLSWYDWNTVGRKTASHRHHHLSNKTLRYGGSAGTAPTTPRHPPLLQETLAFNEDKGQ